MGEEISNPLLSLVKEQGLIDDLQYEEVAGEVKRSGTPVFQALQNFGIMDEQPLIQNYFFSPQMYGEIVALRLRDMKKIRLTHNKWEEGAPQWVKGIR